MTHTSEVQDSNPGPAARSTSIWTPGLNGLQASNGDPNLFNNSTILVAGTVYVHRIEVPVSMVVSNLWCAVATAGSALGSGAGVTVASLFTATGAKLADSADQSAAWVSTGAKQMPISPQTLLAGNAYYVTLFCGSGTTMPTMNRGVVQATANAGISSVANLRWSVAATGLGTVPASLTLANLTGTGAITSWIGIA